ncbi:MAG: hypothetical protein ABFS09_01890 [Thermodesulfobacteriota bacterium]
MQNHEIVTKLSRIYPQEIVYQITMEPVMSAIVDRLGEEALTLSITDMGLARDEIKTAIDHNLDERDYIEMGLDAWEIVRGL